MILLGAKKGLVLFPLEIPFLDPRRRPESHWILLDSKGPCFLSSKIVSIKAWRMSQYLLSTSLYQPLRQKLPHTLFHLILLCYSGKQVNTDPLTHRGLVTAPRAHGQSISGRFGCKPRPDSNLCLFLFLSRPPFTWHPFKKTCTERVLCTPCSGTCSSEQDRQGSCLYGLDTLVWADGQ